MKESERVPLEKTMNSDASESGFTVRSLCFWKTENVALKFRPGLFEVETSEASEVTVESFRFADEFVKILREERADFLIRRAEGERRISRLLQVLKN